MDILGPDSRRIHAPWRGIADPTSRGWPTLQRPRQRGPDSIVDAQISLLSSEIKGGRQRINRWVFFPRPLNLGTLT
jgi:hypothetical protein